MGIVTDGQTWGGGTHRERERQVGDAQTDGKKSRRRRAAIRTKTSVTFWGGEDLPPPLREWTLVQATLTLLCHGVCGPVSVWAC